MSRWIAQVALGISIGVAGPAAAAPETLTESTIVAATAGRRCTAYLHYRGDVPRWPVMLSLRGTGVYTTAGTASLDDAERVLVTKGLVSVLTLDKPGITPDGTNGLSINDTLYNAYVQDDLVACSMHALAWAATRSSGTSPANRYLLLSGHSEGAQVAVRLLAALARRGDRLKSWVRGLFLSGLPMNPWQEMLTTQLPAAGRAGFFAAIQRRDDAVLRRYGNLTYRYLLAAFAQEPLSGTLQALSDLRPTARFFVYQGLRDRNTPPGPVQAFAARNRQRRTRHEGALRLTARFYPAGHALNAQAMSDILGDVEAVVQAENAGAAPALTPVGT